MLKGRSVIETMIIAFTAIVVFVMFATATTIAIVEILSHGDANTDNAVDGLMSLISAILGALLGLIAGKSDTINKPPPKPPEEPPS